MKNRKAFTLIELLVVISIIALLVSILMPALSNARAQATGAVCLANQKVLSLAWIMYADENDGRIPNGLTGTAFGAGPWSEYNGYATTLEGKYDSIRSGVLFPYVETVEAYHCPGDKRSIRNATTPGWENALGGYRSYSLPGGLLGVYPTGGAGIIPHVKISTIKRPSEKYVFIEEMDGRGGNMHSWIMGVNPDFAWCDPMAIWHNDASTLSFCDGHAEMHHWVDQSTIDWCYSQELGCLVPADEGEDLEFMGKGYAFKRLDP